MSGTSTRAMGLCKHIETRRALPAHTQLAQQFAQHKQWPHPQVLDIFKKAGLFAFYFVADELGNPRPDKDGYGQLHHLGAHGVQDGNDEGRPCAHETKKHPGQARVVHHAGGDESVGRPRVHGKQQPAQAEHDERDGRKVDDFVGHVLVAFAVVGDEDVNPAF